MKSFVAKAAAYARVLPRARRNRLDLVRFLARRPAILAGVGAYEAGLFASSRVDNRTKALAVVKASGLIGCPF
jgi:alkylhydroperoxidase family enzyme